MKGQGSKAASKKYGSFAGLDIGTEKVCCAIGSLTYDGGAENEKASRGPQIFLAGFGQRASKGLNVSGVSEMEALRDSILNAVFAAEEAAKKNINEVFVNIPAHLSQGFRAHVRLSLSGQTPIQPVHLRKLFSLSQNISLDERRSIIHVLPISYQLDEMRNIQDPIGMMGHELSADCYVITSYKSYLQNLIHCIGLCNLDVSGFVADSYAASLACLVEDEAELGATLIDMGGKSTQMACFHKSNLVWQGSIPLGGFHFTSDLAQCLSTTLSQAERIKTLYGSLVWEQHTSFEQVPITQVGEESGLNVKYVSRHLIFDIIKARADEILEKIVAQFCDIPAEIDRVVFQKILLTGGATQLFGWNEFMENIFHSHVRLAPPLGIFGNDSILQSPSFATCAGLLKFALQEYSGRSTRDQKPLSFFQKISLWLNELT
jgi:cell division protein FtsA